MKKQKQGPKVRERMMWGVLALSVLGLVVAVALRFTDLSRYLPADIFTGSEDGGYTDSADNGMNYPDNTVNDPNDYGNDYHDCEKYQSSNGKTCETCYDSDGNVTGEQCWDEGGTNSGGGDGYNTRDNNGGDNSDNFEKCEESSISTGETCKTCYDSAGNMTHEDCWGGDNNWDDNGDTRTDGGNGNNNGNWDNGTVNSGDLAKSQKDMKKQLTNFKEKEWDRLTKRIERQIKKINKAIDRLNKLGEKALGDDYSVDGVDDVIASQKEGLALMEALLVDTEAYRAAHAAYVSEVTSLVDSLSSTSTHEDMEKVWEKIRNLDLYWGIRNGLEFRLNAEEMLDQVWDMKKEIAKVRFEYARLGAEMSTDVAAEISELSTSLEGFLSIRKSAADMYDDVITAVGGIFASSEAAGEDRDYVWELIEDLNWEREDMWESMEDFWWDEPWTIIDEAWRGLHSAEFQKDFTKELEWIRGDIADAEKFAGIVKPLVSGEHVKKAVSNLSELAEKASIILDDMESALAEGVEHPEDFWHIMDRVGRAAEENMEVVIGYIEKHSSVLDGLSEDEKTFVKDFMHRGFDHGDEYDEDVDRFVKSFDKKLNKVVEDVMQEVMRNLNTQLMDDLEGRLSDEMIAEVVARVLDNMDVFGDKASQLLENNVAVYDKMEDIDTTKVDKRLRDLHDKTKNTVIASDIATELGEAWNEASTLVAGGATDAEIGEIVNKIEPLLEENQRLLVFEEKVEFYDVTFEDGDWYYESVTAMRQDGVVDGYSGDKAGQFGPGDLVTYAEIAKMAMEAAGYNVSGTPSNSAAQGQWFAAYVATAEREGFGFVSRVHDWNSPASRGDAAVMVAQIFGLGQSGYAGVFPDVDTADSDAGYYQALYDADVFTGEGDGSFNKHGQINRASIAKVIKAAKEVGESANFIEELDSIDVNAILKVSTNAETR